MSLPRDDWRMRLLNRLPETAERGVFTTHPALRAGIETCAAERRLSPEDYVMRAARAFVAYDLGIDLATLAESEPPIAHVLSRHHKTRRRGRGFGRWQIVELR